MKKGHYTTILLIILVISVVSLSACSGNSEKNNSEQKEKSQMPEVSDAFVDTEDMIKALIYDIDAIKGIEEALSKKEENKMEVTEESDKDMAADEKEESAEKDINIQRLIMENSILINSLLVEEIEGDATDIEELPNTIDDIWYEINKIIGEIHNKWNLIERDLKKANVDEKSIKEYEILFDECTLMIQNRDRIASLKLLNEITYHLADFRKYFSDKVPSEVVKMTAHNRRIILLAYEDKYEEALKETETLKDLLNSIRNKLLEKNAEDVIEKTELSIEDLERELNKKDFRLTQIKAAVVVKNTQLMKEVFESVVKK